MSDTSLINCELICANANTTLHCLDYNIHYNCLAYGSHNLIHINNPSEVKTYLTLKGHSKRVNVIKFIDNQKKVGNKLIELISQKKIFLQLMLWKLYIYQISKNIFQFFHRMGFWICSIST